MTFRELCAKEVVQLSNGACLGKADDLELDPQTAQIQSLQLLGRPRFFGLLGRDADDPVGGDRQDRRGCRFGPHRTAAARTETRFLLADAAALAGWMKVFHLLFLDWGLILRKTGL